MARTPEGDIKVAIVLYLSTLGGVVEPLHTGISRGGSGKHYSTPIRSLGRPDIFMLLNSMAIAVEVKRPGGKQRPSQAEWQLRWTANGGLYWIVDSVEAAILKYEELTR